MSTLENPFHPPLKGSGETDTEKDVRLVQKLLGDEDAALLASVRGKQTQRTETMPGDIMTEEEREMLAKAEKREQEQTWDREGYIKWAESIGRDEAWVDEIFVFNNDGTVETKGNLDCRDIKSLSFFPTNLTTVHGSLNLFSLTAANNLTFPQTVVGYLDLHSLSTANHVTLPQTVGRYLSLPNLTTAIGLALPQTVGGSLALHSLISLDNIALPRFVGGELNLGSLTSDEKTIWPTRINNTLIIPRAFTDRAKVLKMGGVLKGKIVYTN